MIRRHVYITPDQVEYLGIINKLTISEHIRRAIDEYIKKLKDENVSSSESKRREDK